VYVLLQVDDLTLNIKKAVMEQTFEKNRKRPDDPDFKYEVEVEFDNGPLETCEWDSDDKESDNEF
jgi:centrosomal protein CEP19